MKKIFALTLAVAMVLSLASVAFAATSIYYAIDSMGPGPYKIPSKKTYVDVSSPKTKDGDVNYGNTIYYPLTGRQYDKDLLKDVGVAGAPGEFYDGDAIGDYVVKYEAVKGVKISADWDVGGEWVSKVELVKKKAGSNGDYIYFLAITFKSAPNKTEASDVVGEIVLKKTSGDNQINRLGQLNQSGGDKGETEPFPVNISLVYKAPDDDAVVYDSNKKYVFGDKDDEIAEDEEYEFTFDKWVDANFVVNTYGQGEIVLKATTDYNSDIGAMYPEANLDFYNGNGAVFNKTGEMFIPADEGSYIYEVKNGQLVAIAGAEYDEYDEGFYFRTRTLGSYVVSDIELNLAAAPVVTPDGGITVVEPDGNTQAPTITNPPTGAAA